MVEYMSGTTEEFSRVKTCALLKDGGRNLTDGMSVRFDHLSRWLAGARRTVTRPAIGPDER